MAQMSRFSTFFLVGPLETTKVTTEHWVGEEQQHTDGRGADRHKKVKAGNCSYEMFRKWSSENVNNRWNEYQ